jgi:hypothetical protein
MRRRHARIVDDAARAQIGNGRPRGVLIEAFVDEP